MKRLLCLMLLISSGMMFAASITGIRVKEYYGSVCRLVLDMDQDTEFIVETVDGGHYLGMRGFDGKLPQTELGGTFLSSIEPYRSGLLVKSPEDLAFYSMRLSETKSIVVDFYKKDSSKASRLAIARFNSDKGRLVAADRDFSKLAVDYPNHYDVFYHWGILLLKRESSRAKETLMRIPPDSPYYESAQSLLSGTETQAVTEVPAIAETTSEEQDPIAVNPADSVVYHVPETIPESITTPKDPWLDSSLYRLLPHFIIAAACIFALAILILVFRRKGEARDAHGTVEEVSSVMDTNTLTKIVNRLLADGWTNKEIARELRINVTEVEQIIRRLHHTGDPDASGK